MRKFWVVYKQWITKVKHLREINEETQKYTHSQYEEMQIEEEKEEKIRKTIPDEI